ncbi:F-box/LRR-repeat protein 18 [Pteropus vampyrus]|uniref:F-box/LRR-repeat protein 18 n=1 Tax=Pteropus vampyrus TaxID=132908 RepID=A0A6P6CM22_PTEVA|nr:F-box/LRR-repeat protein 18 [Pteropus vampyrus]
MVLGCVPQEASEPGERPSWQTWQPPPGIGCRATSRLLLQALLVPEPCLSSLPAEDYEASEDKVKQLVKEIGREIQQLNMAGCYWLSGSTIEHVARCRGLVKVNLSGCHLTSLRLSKMLSALQHLRSLAIDVSPGFDASQLSGECKATLSRVRELKQTLFTPSYGVVPCCTSLEKLLLYFEILDRTREGAILSGQLMVGQSNVPHYQNLRVFYARLAPGYINQEVVRLYLAVLSDRTPENLHAFLISVPGSFAESGATKNLLDSMARNVVLDALQLPKSWLNGSSLLQHLKFNNPFYFSFSRCTLSGGHLIQRVINGGKDLRSLASLNLSGCVHCLSPDSLLRKAEDDIDSGILETLVVACGGLRHLNLSAAHHHSSERPGRHLCQLLARLRHLRSLSLPVCSVDLCSDGDMPPTAAAVPSGAHLLGFSDEILLHILSHIPSTDLVLHVRRTCRKLAELCLDKSLTHTVLLQDYEHSSLSSALSFVCGLRAGSRSVLWRVAAQVPQLSPLPSYSFVVVLAPTVTLSVRREVRVEDGYSAAPAPFFERLSYIVNCLVTFVENQLTTDLKDRISRPAAVTAVHTSEASEFELCASQRPGLLLGGSVGARRAGALPALGLRSTRLMARCLHVVMCHMFTGESLATCKSLQQSLLRSFQAERPALDVVIFPLLHEGLADVIRDVPMVHLDEITLFKSRVAEEPPNLWW